MLKREQFIIWQLQVAKTLFNGESDIHLLQVIALLELELVLMKMISLFSSLETVQQEKMVHSHVEEKLVMKVKSSSFLKIILVILVFYNLNGLFLKDKFINALI